MRQQLPFLFLGRMQPLSLTSKSHSVGGPFPPAAATFQLDSADMRR